MGDAIAGDAPLDSASIQIFLNQNRYEAFVSREKQTEEVAMGHLDHLLPHLPGINDLCAKGFDANFDLKLPENMHCAEWFTKATVKRFLDVVSSPDLINVTNAIINEMSQLEESKNFHLSLYGKDHKDHLVNGERDDCSLIDVVPTSKTQVNTMASDASKNELLRAMDLRFTALSKELQETFNKATDSTFSSKEMAYLAQFSQQFGAIKIENTLRKLIELNQKSQGVGHLNNETTLSSCNVINDGAIGAVKDPQNSKPVYAETPVKYGVSPAKVAQLERQSSTESEESSFSSDEGQTSAERSRSLTRSATPRRAASPMRRIQIGRAGPRRAAALTIKSLNYIPARERTSQRDGPANGCEEEMSEKPYKKPEIDVRRITVQDAINLFESKQRDQTEDIQKRRSLADASINTNKSVLRRWSAGMGETSVQCQPQIDSEDSVSVTSNDMTDSKNPKNSEVEVVSDFVSVNPNNNEITENDVKPEREENLRSSMVDNPAETNPTLGKEFRKLAASAEWNQQKLAEYDQILMKMMESKPAKLGRSQPSKNQNIPSEQRGGSYDHYKEKRDAKLRGDNAKKGGEKEAQLRAMQQILDKRKAEMVSKNVTATKKSSTQKTQKSLRNLTQPAKSPKETLKPSITKKVPSKTSLPATRKSWSATPSPRAVGTSPAKARGGISSANTTPTRRKPQPAASVPQPSPQREKTQQRIRKEKETPTDNVRSVKSMNQKRQPGVTNKSKTMKEKVTTASGDSSATSKISLPNKGTKKSSVVPLESKPFLRKGSRTGNGVVNTNKKKSSPKLEESLTDNGVLIDAQESDLVVNTSDLLSQHSDRDTMTPSQLNAATESEPQIDNHLQCGDSENVDQHPVEVGDVSTNVEWSSSKMNTEESTISPTAWVEIEEHMELPKPCEDSAFQATSPANIAPVGLASPRVRHSLSQMLQEESSEPDTCEWGNAENPPVMIYQKDAPKGLKRLLKFARKSKGDTNSTGWSSPSVFSEGEDDAEESKNCNKRNAENLLRKAALHAKSYGQPKSSSNEGYEKNLDLNKHDGKGTHKMHEGRDFGASHTTKASRSFFSLSAFRGSKPSEAKFH